MGRDIRGVRTGTGPYRGSYRRRVEGRGIGRRQEAGEECLFPSRKGWKWRGFKSAIGSAVGWVGKPPI